MSKREDIAGDIITKLDANKEIFYKKDMGVLARSGFSYDLSKEVLALDKKQLKIYEKKL
jgi:regulatory protein